jgi:four helix bundle protein
MSDSFEHLKKRTKQYALRTIRLASSLPETRICDAIRNQLVRSGTSVGANYRAACRAKSPRDFCAKMGIVEEEADESVYWMELIIEAGFLKEELVKPLMQEGNELTAIAVASINTSRGSTRKAPE